MAAVRQMIADTEFVLQEEGWSQTSQFAFGDDGFAVGQQIGFVHEMSRQQNYLRLMISNKILLIVNRTQYTQSFLIECWLWEYRSINQ